MLVPSISDFLSIINIFTFWTRRRRKREKTGSSNSSNAIFFLMAMHTNSLVYYYTYIHILLLVAFTPSLISLLANKIPPFLNVRVGFKKWWQKSSEIIYWAMMFSNVSSLTHWYFEESFQTTTFKIYQILHLLITHCAPQNKKYWWSKISYASGSGLIGDCKMTKIFKKYLGK